MRADRLVSLVLLLRQRGRMTTDELAVELEVSARTVMRDVEALSGAGVPVYTERGRHGGVALLPGFRTELTGLTHDEALALLATSGHESALGLGPELASAMRKVVDALPAGHRDRVDGARRRLLVEPTSDLLGRPTPAETVPEGVMGELRRAVVGGTQARLHYASGGQPPRWRTVDPIGLVTVRGRTYLLATSAGQDRTYRASRVSAAQALETPAERPADVDLDQLWAARTAAFLSQGHLPVQVRVAPGRREALLDLVESVRAEQACGDDGWTRLEVTFQDLWHAEWALWQLGTGVEALTPLAVREALHRRADEIRELYAP